MRANAFKKFVGAAAVVGVLCVGTVSAQINMSAGVQGAFRSNFGGGVEYDISIPPFLSEAGEIKIPYIGGGLTGFFDLTYAEVSVGLTFGSVSIEGTMFGEALEEEDGSFTSIDIGLLGKYPVDLGNMIFFPAVGIEYQLIVGGDAFDTDDSRLWFKFGAGFDFPLNDAMFLRATALYGIGLASKNESDLVDMIEMFGTADRILSHGLDIRVGVGFRF